MVLAKRHLQRPRRDAEPLCHIMHREILVRAPAHDFLCTLDHFFGSAGAAEASSSRCGNKAATDRLPMI